MFKAICLAFIPLFVAVDAVMRVRKGLEQFLRP